MSATDPDAGANGQFRYSIESGDSDDQFSMDGMNGLILMKSFTPLHNQFCLNSIFICQKEHEKWQMRYELFYTPT